MKSSNTVKFNSSGRLVIMQVSDPQDMVHVRPAMVKMLDAAYDKIRPDLVLFTGDNILGNHLLDARIGNRKVAEGWRAEFDRMEQSLAHILNPLEKRGIPFAMIYGNHDDMNSVTKEEQIEIYRKYSMSLPMNTDNPAVDCDTYNIPVMSRDGKKQIFNIWMLDSAWTDKAQGRGFAEIKEETVGWYNKTQKELEKQNGTPVPSLMFLHIPLPVQSELVEPCNKNDAGAVRFKDGTCMRLVPGKAAGALGEPLSLLTTDNGLFESVRSNGDVMAIISGHDHSNCFEGEADGVKIIQTPAASFRCYGSNQRGVRVFVLDENKPGEFETYMLRYEDLCGTSPKAKLRYIWDADDKIPLKCAMIAGTAAASFTACALIAKIIKKTKQ